MKHFKLIKPIWLAAMLLLSSVPLTATAYDFMVDGLAYNVNGDSTSVTVTSTVPSPWDGGNYSELTTANIPSSVTYDGNTYSVTSIGYAAFYQCSGLTSVTIPSSVTNIGEGAFYGCRRLASVTIPNSVTSIGDYTFFDCSGLTSVTIGNSVTSIGYAAFYNCSGLTSVTIPNSVTSIGYAAFCGCSSLTRELVIPNSVTSIGDYAFSDCSGLTLVTIPSSVTNIGEGAFYGCSGLTSIYNRIDHPSDVTLGSNVFEYVNTTVCTLFVRRGRVDEYRNADQWKDFENIVEASVYDFMVDGIAYSFNDDGTSVTVTYTESWSTNNYSGLITANIPSSVTYNGITYSVTSIGKGAFYGCSELTGALTIPNSVTSIDDYAFNECSGLTSINIPNSVTSIGDYAFSGCSGLTSVTIGNSVTSIGQQAFNECSDLTSVHITDLAAWCNIAFGSTVSNPLYFAHHLFLNGNEVKDLVIPNSVTSIGSNAFLYCSDLTSVTIPNSVISIGNYAFIGCSGLTSVSIPNSVTSIGNYAFKGCSGLTSVSIPNSVTSIGGWAFASCSGLTSIQNRINHPSDVTLGSNVFGYVDCTLYVRRGRVDEYRNADQWKNFKNIVETSVYDFMVDGIAYYFNDDDTSVTVTYTVLGSTNNYSGLTTANIPSSVTYNSITYSVTSIGNRAFEGCSSLTSVTIPNSVTSIGNCAFYGCSGLTSVTIPNSVITIGGDAFYGCSGLTSVTIPNSVITIGGDAFYGCSGLTSVTIPNSVTYIGNSAFGSCSGLTSITIPNSVITIGGYAFYGCSGLTSVTLCGGVENIGNKAFPNVYALILKDSVVSIKNLGADSNQIYCYATTPPECDENSFTKYTGTLHVPENSLVAYATADYWSNFANLVNDAVEPQSVLLSQSEVEIEPGNTLTLTATVTPSNATPNTVRWTTSNSEVATVATNGRVTAVGFGECDITATVLDKTAVCHVTVREQQVVISLDNHELYVGVNKIAWLTPSMSPVSTDLAVESSNTGVAIAQMNNGRVRVIGVSPGVATVTVSSVDGTAQPDSCVVTVEPDFYYLTITSGGHASVRQKVAPRGTYTYTLTPNGSEGRVKMVKFNGEDVTSQVSNGYYTTPAITQNSTLEITFE